MSTVLQPSLIIGWDYKKWSLCSAVPCSLLTTMDQTVHWIYFLTSIPSMAAMKPNFCRLRKSLVLSSFSNTREKTQTSFRRATSCWNFVSGVSSEQSCSKSSRRKVSSLLIIWMISVLLKRIMELRADIMFSSNRDGVGRITSWIYCTLTHTERVLNKMTASGA